MVVAESAVTSTFPTAMLDSVFPAQDPGTQLPHGRGERLKEEEMVLVLER